MKVLFITRKYPPQVGGMENLSYYITNGIDCDKKILALRKRQHHLLWFFPYALIYALFNANKFDLVHIGDFLLCSIGCIIKLLYPKTKVVVEIHGLDVTFRNAVYQKYIRLFGKGMDRYICISRHTAEIAEKLGYGPRQIIPVGIDISKYKSAEIDKQDFHKEFDIPQDHKVMITVGRLVKRKGVSWFLQNVMDHFAGEKITYLIIGAGPEEDNIRQIVSEKELENVRLLGRVEDAVLKRIYKNADIFVMPNIKVEGDMEGFGIVAIEASLAGLILIASGIEGIKDAVEDGKNGLLLSDGNADGYKEQLTDVLQNFDKYQLFAKNASEYTAKRYSWENICKEYKQVFEEVLKG
jgi:phosphatidylinositol alpha-1,6-mannosyltransferase